MRKRRIECIYFNKRDVDGSILKQRRSDATFPERNTDVATVEQRWAVYLTDRVR